MLLGIELEVESPTRSEGQRDLNAEAQAAVQIIANASQIEIEFGRDGGGIENKFSPMSFKWIRNHRLFFQQILTHYKNAGFKSNSSRTAGIHIHFDRKVFTKENFIDFVTWLRMNKEFLHDFSNRQSRTSYTNVENTTGKSGYAFREVNKDEWAQRFETWSTPDPYSAITTPRSIGSVGHFGNDCITLNGNGSGTIECRFFNSTTDSERFMANIAFIHALVFFIKSDREKTLDEFVQYCNDYRWKYLDFVNFYLVPKGLLEFKEVSEPRRISRGKVKLKRKSNVQFV